MLVHAPQSTQKRKYRCSLHQQQHQFTQNTKSRYSLDQKQHQLTPNTKSRYSLDLKHTTHSSPEAEHHKNTPTLPERLPYPQITSTHRNPHRCTHNAPNHRYSLTPTTDTNVIQGHDLENTARHPNLSRQTKEHIPTQIASTHRI